MTTAYTSLLGLALPVTGELSGTWGDTVNNSITSLLDSAIAGTTTLTADTTLTTTTGASNQARQAILLCTGHAANITITAPAQSKIYTVINASATYTVKIRGVGPTTGITIPVSSTATVAWNGSDFVDASGYINGNLKVNGTLSVTGAVTFTAATASTTTGTGTLVITGGLGVSGRINAANFDGIVGANTATTGSFTSITASTTLGVTGVSTLTAGAVIQGLTVGKGAGAVATNTAVGASALAANTSGASGVAIGYQALQNNTTANYNTAVGYQAVYTNTTGAQITAMGYKALFANTTGADNNAFGFGALGVNTTGNYNVAVGRQAMDANTTGSSNTALGHNALATSTTASNNTAVGYQAGYSNTTGSANTFVGYLSGNGVTTGSNNVIIGRYNGSAAPISATGNNYIVLADGDGNIRQTIDSSGNVGIGTSSPASKFDVAGTIRSTNINSIASGSGVETSWNGTTGFLVAYNRTASAYLPLELDGSTVSVVANTTDVTIKAVQSSGNIILNTNSTERARIDGSGNLLVGKTATGLASSGFEASASGMTASNSGADAASFNRNTSDGTVVIFRRSSSGVGTISVTTTATSYNTSSDYRLKENIMPMTGALTKVAQLKPVTYKWKVDGSDGQGFIAHELAEIVPQCVSGAKDAVDADGKPQYQGIDTSFLVATLTAAIQEQQALITALTARITALETK